MTALTNRLSIGKFVCFLLTWPFVFGVVSLPAAAGELEITVPDGFVVELVAGPPLVEHPMMGCFDERGRLFLAESAGRNLNAEQLEEARPNSIRMLEDVNGDGKFDRHTVFADKLAIPNGAVWLDGSLYIAEPPGIWRLTDTDDDGIADERQHIAGNVRSNGMSSTLHGPTLHPSGRLFWCGGQMGYSLDLDKLPPEGGIAPGVFSLRPDGTEHEIYAVGGRANPVEVAFGTSGDVFGTLAILDFPDGARHDALMHWVYGGLYPSRLNIPGEVYRTGNRLPPLSHVGQVAPAGITRYRGTQPDANFRDDLFWTQFNTHKLVRTSLASAGATYAATDHDFAVSTSVDFHPTDVIEDADGSLLLIDTGGWFRHGCPTSRIARPQALGAIYRIRQQAQQACVDPRGNQISWELEPLFRLVEHLSDPRPVVVERAMDMLAKHKGQVVAPLRDVLATSSEPEVRLSCLWTLARKGTPNAMETIIAALDDESHQVRQAAANALGLARYGKATAGLLRAVSSDEDLMVRREAAAALARIGKVNSVAPLINALDDSDDVFYQHAIIDALIRIGHTDPLVASLRHEATAIRRGSLLAIHQIGGGSIAPETIQPMLVDGDSALREAAFAIAREDERLQSLMAKATRILLADEGIVGDVDQQASLREMLAELDELSEIQRALATVYDSPETGTEAKTIILDVILLADLKKFPQVWMSAVASALTGEVVQLRERALAIVASRRIPEFDELLIAAASNDQLPGTFRIGCLETVASRLPSVPPTLFEFVTEQLANSEETLDRTAAARALSGMDLSDNQLHVVADKLANAESLVLPSLLMCFSHSPDAATGELLISALEKRQNVNALPGEQLAGLIRRFPAEIQDKAGSVLSRIGVNIEEQEKRMAELMSLVDGGDVLRGKEVFFGNKASCSACHRVKGQGGLTGPNLTTIATIRTSRDLLESIIYPNASIVQDYRPVNVLTIDGNLTTGLVIRKTEEEVWLQGSDLAEVRIRYDAIEEMREATVSIMPKGLEEKLSRNELRDLLAFLLDLKPSSSYLLDEESDQSF